MIRKYFLIPAALSLALMLVAADFAQAQRRRGNGGQSGGRAVNSSRNYYPRGSSNRSYSYSPYRYGRYGSGYGGYGNTWYPGGWFGYGMGYGGYGNPGGYYANSYSYPNTSYYYSPSTDYVDPAPVIDNAAQIRVILPDPMARVWFDGTLTRQTGNDRMFHTPPLNPNVSNTYRIRASWMQDGREVVQERVVQVTPGQAALVDFR